MAPESINYAGMTSDELLKLANKATAGIAATHRNTPLWNYWYNIHDRIDEEVMKRMTHAAA